MFLPQVSSAHPPPHSTMVGPPKQLSRWLPSEDALLLAMHADPKNQSYDAKTLNDLISSTINALPDAPGTRTANAVTSRYKLLQKKAGVKVVGSGNWRKRGKGKGKDEKRVKAREWKGKGGWSETRVNWDVVYGEDGLTESDAPFEWDEDFRYKLAT